MKKLLAAAALATACGCASLLLWERTACAGRNCKDTYLRTAPDTNDHDGCRDCRYTYTKHWVVYFLDGYQRRIDPYAYGQYKSGHQCPPIFETPTFEDDDRGTARWRQKAHSGRWVPSWPDGIYGCANNIDSEEDFTVGHTCQSAGACSTSPDFFGNCEANTYPNYCGQCCSEAAQSACASQGWYFNSVDGDCRSPYDMCWDQQYECTSWGQSWNSFACGCTDPCAPSPILVDVSGDGFRLTDSAGGVDRDGDGLIGKGAEMFGNFTYQPHAPAGGERQGFLGLAEFDLPAGSDNGGMGGNGDGVIDESDAVFASLRLWQDANHNGVSEPGELRTLPSLDVARLHLDYKESKRADEFGNRFLYRAKVDDAKGAKVGRWAWDVFLVGAP
jgi:hypothetical protein